MSQSVLYITYDGLTSHIGQAQVLPYIVGLRKRGHRFTIVSFEAPDDLERLGENVQSEVEKLGIEWVARPFRRNPPLLAKFIDQIDMMRTTDRLAKRGNFDIVHCRSYIAADVGLKLKQRHGLQLLFDMRGFWVDQRLDGGRWRAESVLYSRLYKMWKKKEANYIRSSDAIVVLADAAREAIMTWPSYAGAPITVIPCCLDFEIFERPSKEDRMSARSKLNIAPDAVTLVYLGSLGTVYCFQQMLAFFVVLKQNNPDAKFLLVGKHDAEAVLAKARAVSPNLGKDDFRYVRCARQDVPYWLGATDLAICFIIPSFSSLGVSPTKLGEYLAVGLPVVCNSGVGDVKAIVEGIDGGVVVDGFDETELRKAVDAVPKLLLASPDELRTKSRALHDLSHAIETYDRVYCALSAKNPGRPISFEYKEAAL